VLARCGKPLLPVLNFVGSHGEEAWRTALARLGLHALVRFDTVAPALDGERRLYESLALLLDKARPQLQRLIEDHEQQARLRLQSGRQLIAELLIDCAACRQQVKTRSQQEPEAIEGLRMRIRQREQRCVEDLLRLYAFHPDDVLPGDFPLLDGRWGDDLFNPETLRQLGLRVGGGAAAGAAAGAGIDLLVGGLSLGAASLLGALAGGGLQTARNYGDRLLGKLSGKRELSVDDHILRLLAMRQMSLLGALERRGHAARDKLQMDQPQSIDWCKDHLPDSLRKARAHPEWSSLNPVRLEPAGRQAQIMQLVRQLS
jgi:hypothetical protein